MESRNLLVSLQYLVYGRNALTMASQDMASACEAEVSESPVVKDIDQERLKSSMLEHGRQVRTEIQYDYQRIIQLAVSMTLLPPLSSLLLFTRTNTAVSHVESY